MLWRSLRVETQVSIFLNLEFYRNHAAGFAARCLVFAAQCLDYAGFAINIIILFK